jgi:DNA mismatch repair protein MutS
VHVAELAGVPAPVVRRAGALLTALEKHGGPQGAGAPLGTLPLFAAAMKPPEEPPPERKPDPVTATLAELDPDSMSPRDALAALYRLKALLAVPVGDPSE